MAREPGRRTSEDRIIESARDEPFEPGVSEALAAERAAHIGDVRYELTFTIPPEQAIPVAGRAIVRFVLATPRRVVLDFAGGAVHRMQVAGVGVTPVLEQGHLIVPAALTRAGDNDIAIEFEAGDVVLNRRERLLYSLFVPARAHVAFPCFDQPDLKARFTLTLCVPGGWDAVSNTPEAGRSGTASGCRIVFGETAPLPTYLFAFAAGELAQAAFYGGGRRLRIVHVPAQAAEVARHGDAITGLHARALDWLEQYTGVPCPFPFDVVLIPSFQFRGMEHPGAVFYDASRLLLPPSPTQAQLFDRASLIAHETAHMWFGNLVTMRWFSDVWLKEVFANLFAAKVVQQAFPEVNHAVRFLVTFQPEAYQVDRTAGSNPVRQPLGNLRDAGQLYGPIVYQKSVVAMRQLEAWVGGPVFRRAVRRYLADHAFGTAGWADWLAIVARHARRDLSAWGHAWIEARGRPEVRVELKAEDTGRIGGLTLRMRDPLARGLVWPQEIRVAIGYPGRVHEIRVRMRGSSCRVTKASGLEWPSYVLPGGELGYGLFLLDDDSRRFLLERIETIGDPLTRADAWITLWENVLAGSAGAPAFLQAAMRALPREADELVAERVLGYVVRAFWRLLTDAQRGAHAPALEAFLRDELRHTSRERWRAACFTALRETALTPPMLAWLTGVWRREEAVPGLTIGEAEEMALALELAVRGGAGGDALLRAQIERMSPSDRRAECTCVAPAVSSDEREREAAFERLCHAEHRRPEPWALQSLRWLNHPLRSRHAHRFLRPALALLPEIQQTGDIFFPARWADAALWGHQSADAAITVQTVLAETDLPQRLRWVVLTAADDLLRTHAREPVRTP